jgi:predicted secreted protein
MAQDVRSGKVVLVAYCILNQNSRVLGLARYPAVIPEIVDTLTRHNIGIIQMPCPEIAFAGLKRAAQTKEQYDKPKFRKYCRQIAISLADQVQEYLQNDVKVVAVLGVEGSPSCGVSEASGILMEELKAELEQRSILVPFHELDFKEIRACVDWLENIVRS